MREIEFRAWDTENEVMITPDYNGDHYIMSMDCGKLELLEANMFGSGYQLVESVFLQYTGLKDKNGVKIFEGDIVECWTGPDGFIEQSATVTVEFTYSGLIPITCSEFQQVIGNIHENPELIGESK